MKEKSSVNAAVMKMALRKSGIHVKDMFYKKIVAEVIGNIIESDQQGQQPIAATATIFVRRNRREVEYIFIK